MAASPLSPIGRDAFSFSRYQLPVYPTKSDGATVMSLYRPFTPRSMTLDGDVVYRTAADAHQPIRV
ncbi:MAG: hypothetical protein A4E34_01029 [Methanoregula sp. PtaU1.Bin006]|nr:MAG: hypothetical protein A4E34_01029 [Methanoregula sp. PtaU1.Bin006]